MNFHRIHPSPSRYATIGKLCAVVMLALALGACGDKVGKKSATQVAAKVGSEEISVHQINFVLARTNTANATPENADRLRHEVLEKLIDQQLAVNQAVEQKLDRSPEVVSQLEAARREVLARAYVQQLAAALPKPTADEAKKYYADNPALFSERRIFNLQEIVVPAAAGADVLAQVKAQVAAGKSMEELANWLKGHNVRFAGNSATRAAEQIPLELLKTVHALKDGQTTIISNAQSSTILRVAASQSAPVTEAAALPRIEQFLANQRGVKAVADNIKELRSKTTVTYMGDFAPGAAGTTGAAPATGAAGTVGSAGAGAAGTAAPGAAGTAAAGTAATGQTTVITSDPPPAAAPAAAAPAVPPLTTPVVTPSLDAKTKSAIDKGVAGK